MAKQRVVEAVLKFKDEFSSGASKAFGVFEKNTKKLQQSGRNIWKAGNELEKFGKGMTTAVTAPVVALGASSVKSYGEIDKSIRLIEETMGRAKVGAVDLGESISKAAKTSVFTMQDATDATLNFARAGFNGQEAVDMLTPSLDLAAGTATDLGLVTEGLGSSLKMFGADSSEAAGYSNILAQAQAQANTTVSDLFESISAGGNSFNTVGWNIKDLSVATGVLGDSMISGSEAGNSFKTGLARLAAPAKQGAAWMESLGLNLFDANGNMLSFTETQKQLHDSFKGLTAEQQEQAASAIFGKNQMDKWLALIRRSPKDIQDMENALDENENTARSMSDALMNGIGGSIEKLKSTFDVFKYDIGEQLAPAIKPFIDRITELMDKFTNLDDGTKQIIIRFALMAAAIGPLTIGTGKFLKVFGNGLQSLAQMPSAIGGVMAPLKAFLPAFDTIGTGMTSFTASFGTMLTAAAPLLGIAAIIGVLAGAFIYLWKTNDEFRAKMTGIWINIRTLVEGFIININKRMPELQTAFTNFINIVQPLWDGFCQMIAPRFISSFENMATILQSVFTIILGVMDVFTGVFTGNFQLAFSGIQSIFAGVWGGVIAVLRNSIAIINGLLGVFGNFVVTLMSNAWAKVKSNAQRAWTAITTNISNAGSRMKSTLSSTMSAMKSTASNKLNEIKNAFTSKMNAAANAVRNAINRIKGMFNFSWSLPPLRVPEVSISGGVPPYGLGGKGSLPHFNVSWHKKAYDQPYLLNNPTIFGQGKNGELLGGGEGAGSEVIIGVEKLTDMMKNAAIGAGQNMALQTVPNRNNITITIPKLADQITVRDQRDIDNMSAALAHQLEIYLTDAVPA